MPSLRFFLQSHSPKPLCCSGERGLVHFKKNLSAMRARPSEERHSDAAVRSLASVALLHFEDPGLGFESDSALKSQPDCASPAKGSGSPSHLSFSKQGEERCPAREDQETVCKKVLLATLHSERADARCTALSSLSAIGQGAARLRVRFFSFVATTLITYNHLSILVRKHE